jgi:SAM-dependent methyltransferase
LTKERSNGVIAELGCSQGDALKWLAANFRFERLIGFDIAIDRPEAAAPGGVEFVATNLNDALPLGSASVDVVVAMMVVEHLFDPFQAFSEIARVLSLDGFAVINLPLVTSLKNRWRLMRGQLPQTSVAYSRWLVDREWDGNHLHYFSVSSIRDLLSACGLQMGEHQGVGRAHIFKTRFPSFLANELSFCAKRIASRRS